MLFATILSPEDITFGHLNAIQIQDQQLVITHWILTLFFFERPTAIQIRRPHNLWLTLCSGCSLNNTQIGSLHQRIHSNRKKTWPCVFACPKTDAIQISDGPRNPANNIATFSQPLLQYIYATCSVNDNALFAHTSALTAMDISTPLQVSTAFRRLSELIKSPPIISILLLLAS